MGSEPIRLWRDTRFNEWDIVQGPTSAEYLALPAPDFLALQRRAEELERERDAYEEREAACCPEDVGFDEYIAALKRRAEEAESTASGYRAILKGISGALIDAGLEVGPWTEFPEKIRSLAVPAAAPTPTPASGGRCDLCGLGDPDLHPCDESGMAYPCNGDFHRSAAIRKCAEPGCEYRGLTRKAVWRCVPHMDTSNPADAGRE